MAGLERVRALTLNLVARNGRWPERREALRSGLRRLRPDVLALQEAVTEGGDDVADLLGPGFHIAHQTVGLIVARVTRPRGPGRRARDGTRVSRGPRCRCADRS